MKKGCGCGVSKIAFWLLVIGGLNWGLTGLGGLLGTNLNVVNRIFGSMMWLEAIIYIVVGIATVISLMGCKCTKCKACNTGGMSSGMGGGQQM